MPDLYQTLGVERGASPEDIKAAYRKLARKHHPDRGGDVETFQAIEEAYRILSDQARRSQYDDTGSTQKTDHRAQARTLVASAFSTLLQANDMNPGVNYVSHLRRGLEQQARTVSGNKQKLVEFIDKAHAMIDVTKGEILVGVIQQRLGNAQGQLVQQDDKLAQIEIAQDMLKGCKCGADVEECLRMSHAEGVSFVFHGGG